MGQIEAVVVVPIGEVVDVVANHGVLAVVESAGSRALACSREVGLERRGSSVKE